MHSLLNNNGLWGFAASLLIITGLSNLYATPNSLEDSWYLTGEFDQVNGLKLNSDVMLSGMPIGQVTAITLMPSLKVQVTVRLDKAIEIPDDSDLRVQSSGLFADPYLALMPGGGFDLLGDGDQVFYTQSGVDFLSIFEQIVTGASEKQQTKTD